MKIKSLIKNIEKRSKEIEKDHPVSKFLNVDHFKSIKDREAYHVDITFEITYSEEMLSKIFSKDIVVLKPHIGFDLDLDYYTDEHIKYTINEILNEYSTWLNQLEDKYDLYSKNIDNHKDSKYLR